MNLHKERLKIDTLSPMYKSTLLVKMVTSYSIFLLVILILLTVQLCTTGNWIYLLILLLAALLGIPLILYFSYNNVKAFIELKEDLHSSVETQNQLLEVVNHQKPIIFHSYIRQLLTGTVTSEDEASYIQHYMELDNISAPRFNVLYAVAYHNFEDASAVPMDEQNTDAIILKTLEQFFGPKIFYYIPSSRTYAVLLPFSAEVESSFILTTQDTVRKIHEYLLENYNIWIFAGIGKNTNSLMNVWESYQQAMEAINYTTKNYIFLPYEMIKKDSNVFYYPPELSTKMIHFITTGNKAQVMELFNLIHEENIEERSLPINLIRFLLSDIRNTLLKARFALPDNTDTETVAHLDEHFNEPLTFQLCESLALTLCKLFGSKDESEALSTTIEKYINSNYQDPSLCLNKISDEFQISESYFSHMFKDKTGVNFSTYLENLRMAEAARLIKETDISLNELYLAVGYNNPNTFRRAFKKIYGVTPSSMR